MIQFNTLTLRNFLSFGNATTTFVFDNPGTTLIVGENMDNAKEGAGGNGVGKAQPLDSLIKTPTGWISMGDVSVGDSVLTPSGKVTQINGIFPQGKKKVYQLTFSDGRTVEACGEHLWKVHSHRWRLNNQTNASKILNTLEVKQLVEYANTKTKNQQPKFRISVPLINGEMGQPLPQSTFDPYLLGALLGDGSLSNNVFTSKDEFLVKKVNKLLSPYDSELIQYTESYDWHIRNMPSHRMKKSKVTKFLNEYSLLETKSFNKFIPSEFLNADLSTKLKLIQGLLDTDGTVGKTGNISFSTVSKQLALDVQYVIRSIGGKATVTERNPSFSYEGIKKQGRTAYNISIQYHSPRDLFTLPRKLERISSDYQYKNSNLTIKSIDFIGEKECQCISVEDEQHLYVTNDFVVTHNTTVINALTYAIYDKPVSSISKDNLVNNINKKNMEVTLTFTRGKDTFKIVRARKAKAGPQGNYVQFFMNEKDITRDSVSHTNSEIEDFIGIPYDIFVRVVVFSANSTPFLDLPVRSHYQANQTDIIETLFDLKNLSVKAELLKKEIKNTEQSITTKEALVEQITKEHKRRKTQIDNTKDRIKTWDKDRKATIKQLRDKLEEAAAVNLDEQQQFHHELNELLRQVGEINPDIASIQRSIKRMRKTLDDTTREHDDLEKHICPYCKQKFHDKTTDEKLSELKSHKHNVEQSIAKAEEKLEAQQKRSTRLTNRIGELKGLITVQNVDELIGIKSEAASIEAKIQHLEEATNPHHDVLEELKSIKLDSLSSATKEINKLHKLIDHQNFMLKLLTKKDSFVRKRLLDKYIPYLNQKLKGYLAELGLPHRVEFTHEMTAKITQFGHELDFGNLSNGQRARVNIALSFAFRDVLHLQQSGLNVCLLDEILDVGLDTVGVQLASNMLKRISRDEGVKLYIISHRDEASSSFERKMTIQLNKGFSYILSEE